MGQVARSMNPPHRNMYDNTLPSSDTSTISSSGENSSTHSPDSISNTMVMDKYPHITSSDNLMDSLPRYDCDRQLLMDSAGKDDDDICLQSIPGSDKDSGNMSKELWNEYRPGLLQYPGLQSKILSPLPGIFHSLQLRNNTDAQPSTTTTADRIAALRSQYDIPFDDDKDDNTVRAIHVAIDELAAMMNTHSLLPYHSDHYPEEQLVKHPDAVNRIPTTNAFTSAPSLVDSNIPNSSTTATSFIEHVSPPPLPPPQALHTLFTDQTYCCRTPPSTATTASSLPAGFQFSFAKDPSQVSSTTACDNNNNDDHQHLSTAKERNQQTMIRQRKILPLPKPRVQRTQQQQQYSTPISSEFTFKSSYHPLSTHSKTKKQDINSTSNLDSSSGMNNETSQDYTKKAKRSGDCYTDDDDEDGGMVYRTCNRYTTSKAIGSSTTRRSVTDMKNKSLDVHGSLLPSTLLQNSFLRPLATESNGSLPPPPSSKSKPISLPLPPLPPQDKRNRKDRSATLTSSSLQSDNPRRNSTNNNNMNRTDTNRNTRRNQHSSNKQLVSPSISATSSTDSNNKLPPSPPTTLTSNNRRKGKKGQDDNTNKKKNDDSRLDIVTSTLGGPDDWICLFCQYEIFKRGWFMAKRKHLIQERHRQRLVEKRLINRRSAPPSSLVEQQEQQQQQFTHAEHDGGKLRSHGQQRRRPDGGGGSKTGSHRIIRQLDTSAPVT